MADDGRRLKVVREPKNGCPFTRVVGGTKMVCTKPPHKEEHGHHMVAEDRR